MIFAFGPYELDTRLFELRHHGAVCPVEPQVFDVLAYLAEHRDRVVAKEELLEKLWPDRFVSETTLTSRVKAARKAVADDGKTQSVIRTLHGRGYRFVAEVVTAETGENVVRPSAPVPAASRPAGFVGRDGELHRLEMALVAAMDGKRQIAFVSGEAGVGKTTLVETFLARLRDTVLVGRGQCIEYRGSGEPYMPLLDALGRLCRRPQGATMTDLLRREAPSWLLQLPWLVSDQEAAALAARSSSSGDRMLRELGMLVERIAEEQPLVLVLEDLHWSDSATLEAIDLLARHSHPARLLVIGTFRPAGAKASRHPVYATAQELRARGQCELIELPRLAVRELEEYLNVRMPGAPFARELAALLHERTSGNALFVGNLVGSWIERGFLAKGETEWALATSMSTLETDVPESLQQLIEKHVAALEEDQQRMLEAASVIGRELSIAFLTAILGGEEEELESRFESLAREGRFVAGAGTEQWGDGTLTSRFAFTHDLYVDVLYDRIAEARKARLHQQAGLALERAWNGREREHAAELALHFRRALDPPRAIRYLDLAAEQAMQRSAYREAVVHFTEELDLLQRTPPSADRDRLELNARARLAPALVATRGWADEEAEQNYLRAAELGRQLGNRHALSQMLYGVAALYEYRGEYRRAERIARERLELDGESATVNALESHELLACSMMHQGRYAEALHHGSRALAALGEGEGVPELSSAVLLVQAHGWMSGGLLFTGHESEAIGHNAAAIRLAEAKSDDLAKASALVHAALIRYHVRDAAGCRRLAEEGEAIARERRLPFHLSCARILLGWCLAQEGLHEQAVREVRAGIGASISVGALMDVPLYLAILAECLELTGDRGGALEALDEAFARIGRNRSFFYLPELYRRSAELLLARGDRDTACAALERAKAIAEEQQSPLLSERVRRTSERIA